MSNRHALASLAALGLLLYPGLAWSQVGHLPGHSPYRDLSVRHALVLQGGYLSGSGGRPAAGPHDGPLLGLRYTIHLGGPFEAIFGVSAADLKRVMHEDSLPPDTTRQSVGIAEVGFGFLLTGEKTWRRLVPYIAATMGAAFGGSVPRDTSGFTLDGFSFDRAFQFGPQVGIRWYASRRLHLRVEGRDIMWRLTYPQGWYRLDLYPGAVPPLIAGIDSGIEWTHNLSLNIALGYALRF
ncbi:MAG: hypothetical protein HY337_00275 [Gemmatimonadetes bacterium]|nr:hypothetical protein [Gemmatimonadota bacterium]